MSNRLPKVEFEYEDNIKYLKNTLSFDDIKQLIDQNKLDSFGRCFSQAKRYKYHFRDYIAKFPNSTPFKRLVCKQLQWAPLAIFEDPSVPDSKIEIKFTDSRLFYDKQDLKFLLNEYPYNFSNDVTHLLLWTKVPISGDKDSPIGDISPNDRKLVNAFLNLNFFNRPLDNKYKIKINPENVTWFRNWTKLQSIKQISHIHIIVKDLPKEQAQMILNDDFPIGLSELNNFRNANPQRPAYL